ncbi:hypothetical protein TUM1881_26150 [Escherichia coli]|nr:hypothetical protein TUM1881_26150 [Escherichia coli]
MLARVFCSYELGAGFLCFFIALSLQLIISCHWWGKGYTLNEQKREVEVASESASKGFYMG